MTSRVVRTNMRLRRRDDVNGTQSEHQGDQQGDEQSSTVVPEIVPAPPLIVIDAMEDDDDVVESTASAFALARIKSRGARRGPVVVDVDSGTNTRSTRRRSDQTSADSAELNKPRKSMAVAPVEEPKFNCPICISPFTEEVSTKCGHIFCKGCIKNAISVQAKCPTCRKKVTAKDLIRVFLPTMK
ncbi:PREDICTED: E3 ubiquitin-protein ligase RNF4-like [Camelina sativa]|uniref:E3 ubiquitin-protein ligase RNF4-like n=1 Tax=Camelina sativa TaxID=90675 RepID=A0ABM0W1E5_CAMSA|nr:PREDICTED: E3 ubiquitin-protein ligase RNF4-like [Camelina sativa]XP_010464332.1 PREDICTED: E3 ubiquitin-protein ligase RNF4-like [Camelina sativa]